MHHSYVAGIHGWYGFRYQPTQGRPPTGRTWYLATGGHATHYARTYNGTHQQSEKHSAFECSLAGTYSTMMDGAALKPGYQ